MQNPKTRTKSVLQDFKKSEGGKQIFSRPCCYNLGFQTSSARCMMENSLILLLVLGYHSLGGISCLMLFAFVPSPTLTLASSASFPFTSGNLGSQLIKRLLSQRIGLSVATSHGDQREPPHSEAVNLHTSAKRQHQEKVFASMSWPRWTTGLIQQGSSYAVMEPVVYTDL
ncbi:UNVERIFIED_CONTAM: hypothetical protein K2H54_038446 [Gekko kuhli]